MSYLFGDRYTVLGYTLTPDPREADNGLQYSETIEKLIKKAYRLAQNPDKDTLSKLLKWVNKYPDVPAFKNYLTSYYISVGNEEKAFKANNWLIKEHPNYLYGRLNLASQYILQGNYEKIPKVIGESLDLQELYPEREIFHIGEFLSFLSISCQYLIGIGEIEVAASRIFPVAEILPDHPKIQFLIELLETAEMEAYMPIPKGKRYEVDEQTTIAPTFTHSEIEALYAHGFEIDPNILKSILALPAKTLEADLQKVLQDSINRFEYFLESEYEYEALQFPLHALLLLTELKTETTLDNILEYLKLNEDVLNFWLEDHYTETIWMLIYHLGQDQLPKLKAYQFEPNIGIFSKGAVLQAMVQIAKNQPERRTEIIAWFKDVGEYFLAHSEEKELIDLYYLDGLINDMCTLQAKELIPIMEQLFAKDLVTGFMVNSMEEVHYLVNKDSFVSAEPYTDIYSFYEELTKVWQEDEEEILKAEIKQLEAEVKSLETEQEQLKAEIKKMQQEAEKLTSELKQNKVGRNDLCPCGSGQKYKKCCMRK